MVQRRRILDEERANHLARLESRRIQCSQCRRRSQASQSTRPRKEEDESPALASVVLQPDEASDEEWLGVSDGVMGVVSASDNRDHHQEAGRTVGE